MQATITNDEGTRDIEINTLEELVELIRVNNIAIIATGVEDNQDYFSMLTGDIPIPTE